MSRVIINPSINIYYCAFYVNGLECIFGKKNISFSKQPFDGLKSVDTMMQFVIEYEQGIWIRYVIDANDSFDIKPDSYDWCDVYGHVNTNWANTPEKYKEKLISLCPSFGVRCWSFFETCQKALECICQLRMPMNKLRKFCGKYKRMYLNRKPLTDYYTPKKKKIISPYIFFCSTLWYNDEWNKNDKGVNKTRANFIRACKSTTGLTFEGGLVPQTGGRSSIDKFADILYKGVDMNEWIKKTKQSDIVFNTPAFWNCHGWKLGEYLALGKCIISTKLSNDLPEPLVHGENIHIVEDTEDAMREAIQFIIDNPEYKHKLEAGARSYWQKYGTPKAALELMGIKNEER